MIGARDWRTGWFQASGVSVAAHCAVVALLLWQPDLSASAPPPSPGELHLNITVPQPVTPAPETSVTAPDIPGEDEVLTPENVLTSVEPEPELLISGATPTAPDPNRSEATPAAAPPEETPDGPPADPRVVELFERIRNRLMESCLLAQPSLLDDEQIQLGVLAADDSQISALMRDLTQGLDTEIQQQAVLLDNRQCPGLAFARRDPSYPVPGLALQLDAQDIASGSNLQGRISGATGLYTTLLMVDDNGVVHDLRRFLVGSASSSRFAIPIARKGQPRDTHHLLLAIATPERPASITSHAGQTADDFFEALSRDIGQRPKIGVASVYIR